MIISLSFIMEFQRPPCWLD